MSDYDNAPTHPHHGGKLMPHQMPQRIEELEAERDRLNAMLICEKALWEAESERADRLAQEVERLTAALKPFAGVPMRGTCGGPMTGSTVGYEDGSTHGISPDFPGYIPKEWFARARAALNPDEDTPVKTGDLP